MRLKVLIAAVIPIRFIRHWFYRTFLHYTISGKSRIGMFNYIACKQLIMEDATIGFLNFIVVKRVRMHAASSILNRNRIKHLNELLIKEGAIINKKNFIGGPERGDFPIDMEQQNLTVGNRSEINRHNYFDVVRPIVIGENVVFGGEGSEIWTHGFERNRVMLCGPVSLGDNIFIGSKCIFTKNVEIASDITIGPGSVIYKSILESGLYSTHRMEKIK